MKTLGEAVLIARPTALQRDGGIKRFEYSFEAVWKAAQHHLKENEGIDVASPKAAIRASFDVGVLTERESRAALKAADDRNLTVHTYNEKLAAAIWRRVKAHHRVMARWLDKLQSKAKSSK